MKVAVCVPHYGDVKGGFARSLFGLSANIVLNVTKDSQLFSARGTLFPHIRNDLAAAALEWSADWLLWIDADQIFPADTLTRLLRHHQMIVACNIPVRRQTVPSPNAYKDDKLVYTTRDKAGKLDLEPVDGVGLGVCLIGRDVFEALRQPYFRLNYNAAGDFETEDYAFCRAAREAGFQPYVDHALSWEIGHVDERVLTNADTGYHNRAPRQRSC